MVSIIMDIFKSITNYLESYKKIKTIMFTGLIFVEGTWFVFFLSTCTANINVNDHHGNGKKSSIGY